MAAALELLEHRGPAALTMRNLADALNTKPMSLYSHVANKDDLVDGILGAVLDDVEPPTPGGPWQDQLRRWLPAVRAALLRHAGAVRLIAQTPGGAAWAKATDHSLSVLRQAGFDPATAVHAHRLLMATTLGSLSNEILMRSRAGQRRPAMLAPTEETPALAEAFPHILQGDYDASFSFAVEAVIGGLELVAPGGRPTSSSSG